MKKIIASILAVFFVLLSPFSAFASTTESMLMYSIMPMSVVDSDDYSVSYARGFYSRSTDSIDLSSYTSMFSNGYTSIYSNYDSYPVLSIKITGSDLGAIGDNISIFDDLIQLSVYNDYGLDTQIRYFALRNSLSPLKSYASFKYSGTGRIGNTHSSGWTGSTTTNIPFPFQPSDVSSNRYYIQMNSSITLPDVPLDDWSNSGSSNKPEEVYNATLKEIKLFFVFNLNQNWINSNDYSSWMPPIQDSPFRFYSYRNGSNFLLTHQEVPNDDNGLSNLGGQIQSSISSVSQSISTQSTEIKQSINLMQQDIKSEISTMSDNISSGLTDVKSSITSLGTTISNKLENVKTAVVNKVTEVKDSVVEVKDSILDLPNKIQEMLLGLIVPDSDTMADKYSEFSGLLEEKLGVIYQIPMMLFDFFDTIVNAATTPQSTLTLPAFTLPWIDGSQLTIWNSMEYKIIPDGLEVLSDLIRTVTSMTVVVLTFNSVKQAYERFLRS